MTDSKVGSQSEGTNKMKRALSFVRSNWFVLVLLAFPAWNFVFYMTVMPDVGGDDASAYAQPARGGSSTQLWRDGGSGGEGASFSTASAQPQALASAREMPSDYSTETWPTLNEVVRAQSDLFETYDAFYGSLSQSWRIRKYGRICFVSSVFMGLTLSSGPGTALTTIAESLAKSGFEVTLLYTREGARTDVGSIDHWVNYYKKLGLNLVPLPQSVNYDVDKDVEVAHRVFMWLRSQESFDVIHFADTKGLGFFATSAKKQGLDFLQTILVVHLHCPHMWYKINSLKLLDQVNDLVSDHLERMTANNADYLVSPSNYMVNWLQSNSWSIERQKVVVQEHVAPKWLKKHQKFSPGSSRGADVASSGADLDTYYDRGETVKITEVVYFARAELKKGLVLFCDALDRLAKRNLPTFSVTFLGKFPNEQDEFLTLPGNINARIEDYIRHRSVKWNFDWQIHTDQAGPQSRLEVSLLPPHLTLSLPISQCGLSGSRASQHSSCFDSSWSFQYLKRAGNRTIDGNEGKRLAVMPSIMENSPLSILECLIAGVPFIATRVGGVEELVPRHLREQVLVEPSAKVRIE